MVINNDNTYFFHDSLISPKSNFVVLVYFEDFWKSWNNFISGLMKII